jgi:hypothetical protein
MTGPLRGLGAVVAVTALAALSGCSPPHSNQTARNALVLGIDVSGSFRAQHYDDAIDFAAYYLYGHLHGLGGMQKPTAVFVGSVGGDRPGEMKSFHPIEDFQNKSVDQIAQDMRTWFPPEDRLTDFNAFFSRLASLIKARNLILAPINIVLLSDGEPDYPGMSARDSLGPYGKVDLSPLEYLSRSVTVRLLYATPTVDSRWEHNVKRNRVRMWTLDGQVMTGWRAQLAPDEPPEQQDRLWSWIADNVDFRVRARIL